MTDRRTQYHAKGQADATKGRYDPPHELPFMGLLGHSNTAAEQAEREAYRKGWHHARAQKGRR